MTNTIQKIEKIRNMGPVTANWLRRIGIHSTADLKRIGAKRAYQMLIDAGHAENRNLWYSLLGAVEDRDWRSVAMQEQQRKR